VAAGTSYDVRVRAANAQGWGPWSNAATVTTAEPRPARERAADEGAASRYKASAVMASSRVLVKWDAVDGVAWYAVARNGETSPGRERVTHFFDSHGNSGDRYEITAHDDDGAVLAVMSAEVTVVG
jgi:hypothetical protein